MTGSSDRDRQALLLQVRAAKLRLAGRDEEAHRLFVAAMDLFGADEDTELVASVAHDLAISLRDRDAGIERENLMRARELVQRALDNAGRRRDRLRWAASLDVRATINRRRAALMNEPQRQALL